MLEFRQFIGINVFAILFCIALLKNNLRSDQFINTKKQISDDGLSLRIRRNDTF